MNKTDRILILKEEPMSAVAFVQDYVEFHFDGKVLTAYTHPVVINSQGESRQFPFNGSRDALCDLIGKVVCDVEAMDKENIVLSFISGERLTISLRDEDRNGPEAAQFFDEQLRGVEVW